MLRTWGRERVVSGVLTAGLSLGLLAAVAACGDKDDSAAQPGPGVQGTSGTPSSAPTAPNDSDTPDDPGTAGSGLPAGCIQQSSLALCLTFDFQGATKIKGSNWAYAGVKDPDLADSTCLEYGASVLKSTEVGLPQVSKVIGSKLIEAQFSSTWPPAKTGIVDYPATGSIRVDDVAYESRNNNTTGQLILQPNGSGRYVLNKLVHTEGGDADATNSISGTISWTCMEAKD
jgi:hypothetical protein